MRFISVGEISEVQGGLQVTRKRDVNPIERPYLRVANVYRDHIDLSEVKTIRVTAAEAERAALRKGDILVVEGHGNPNEIGRTSVWAGEIPECVHQNHLIRVRLNEGAAHPPYVSAYLNSPTGRGQLFKAGKTTSGLNTINISNVKALTVPLPPLPEQKRIAAILDKADEIRKKRAEAIKLTEELLRSAFLEMFGVYLKPEGCKPLEDVCDVLVDCRNKTAPYEHSGIPLIRTTNFRNNALDLSSLKYVSEATNQIWSSRHQTSPGDVVYCREAPFGMAAIVPDGFSPCLGQRIMVARPNHAQVTTRFLWSALNSPFVYRQAERVAVGATVKHLRVRDVETLDIPVPPLEMQEQFSRLSDRIASVRHHSAEHLEEAKAASTSLTQRAFRGDL